MFRFIARRYAKAAYVFRQEREAATNELNAGLARRTAAEKRTLAKQLTEQADQMDARIKEVSEMEEKGFLLCDNGHEHVFDRKAPSAADMKCVECDAPVKLFKRDQMTGQDKYESDRERKDAEDLAKAKRDQAKAEEENAAQSENAAQYFKGITSRQWIMKGTQTANRSRKQVRKRLRATHRKPNRRKPARNRQAKKCPHSNHAGNAQPQGRGRNQ